MGLGNGSNTVLGSTHVVEQLSFAFLLSILTFDFDLIFGSFLMFLGPIGLFLDLVSRDVPTGYFVSSGGYPNVFCALLVHHSLPCRLFSRDVTAWLFRLYWILLPEMSQLVISSLLEVIVSFPPVLTRGLLKFS